MRIDSLVFVGTSHFGPVSRVQDIRSNMDRLEIDRAVLCPFHPVGGDWTTANNRVAEWRADRPDRHYALGRVDPNFGKSAVIEAERALGELAMDGLYLDPWDERFSLASSTIDAVVEVASRAGRPIVVAGGFPWVSEPLQLADLAKRHPSTPFVATHGANINISGLSLLDAEFALREAPNLHLLSNGVYREDFLRAIVSDHGAHRLMYASAAPLTNMELELKRVLWAGFDDGALTQVLHGNWQQWTSAPQISCDL